MTASTPANVPPRSGEAEGPRLLRRLIAPLLRSGWCEVDSDVWYEEDPDEGVTASIELERSGFHLAVSWDTATQELVLDDPTESWEWDESLPPLCPLDDPLTIDLTAQVSQAMRAETARCAFAASGLLDATRIHVPDKANSLRYDLTLLILADHVYGVAKRHRGRRDAGDAFAALGEEFSWRISDGLMRAYPLIVPAPVPAAAARGIAEWCWRRESEVEDWHHKVDDLTMARANIAATRVVLPHVHLEGVDWPAVRLALTLPNRRLGDGRVLGELFDEGWSSILASIHRELDLWQRAEDELGPHTVLRLLTVHGSRTESVGDWWSSGWYETLTRRAIHKAAQHETLPPAVPKTFPNADHFADTVAHSPDALDDDTFRWLTHAIFEEESDRRFADEPTLTALTLPDWAVEQLTQLLATGDNDDPDNQST